MLVEINTFFLTVQKVVKSSVFQTLFYISWITLRLMWYAKETTRDVHEGRALGRAILNDPRCQSFSCDLPS